MFSGVVHYRICGEEARTHPVHRALSLQISHLASPENSRVRVSSDAGLWQAVVCVAASGGHQLHCMEQASPAHPGIRQPQWPGHRVGSPEERAHHQSQWPQQQGEFSPAAAGVLAEMCRGGSGHPFLCDRDTGAWLSLLLRGYLCKRNFQHYKLK